jgi:nucleotide-binding universal stress UspA family protein
MMGSMNILLATDGSAGAVEARDLLASLPLDASTEIHLLGAYEVPMQWAPGLGTGTAVWLDDMDHDLRDELTELLSVQAEPLRARGLAVTEGVVRGRPATAIIEAAAALGTDLIVAGSRGRGPVTSTLLGSVATEVANEAPCSVLVARSARVEHLLVATDGSPTSARIPDYLASWNLFRGLPADVVAVSIPDSPTFELIVGLYTLGDQRLADKRRELRDEYAADASAMASRLESIGIPATEHVRNGDPAGEIMDAAREHGADLVITGTRGRGALQSLLLGSVARKILAHADASVLVVREPGPVSGRRAPDGDARADHPDPRARGA